VEQLSGQPQEPPSTPDPLPRRRGRRVLTVLTMIALLTAAGAGGAIGWQQREIAAGWRDRSVVLEQQRDDAIGRAEALSDQLSELASLEERLAELAGEKALAEDRATVTRAELRTLATTVESAVRQLNACVDDLLALQSDTVAAFNELGRGREVDIAPLNDRLRETNQRCDAARRAGAAAVGLASRLQ
jgi:chromosome segregation ATPase